MTEESPITTEQLIKDTLINELKNYHNEQMNTVLIHPDIYKYLMRKSHKKIKRRLYYEVIWWMKDARKVKYFESVKKMRRFVNRLHSWYDGMVEIQKTWCYREFTPRHKWYYYSWEPNQFICSEKF